jgi:hypothetical protein
MKKPRPKGSKSWFLETKKPPAVDYRYTSAGLLDGNYRRFSDMSEGRFRASIHVP